MTQVILVMLGGGIGAVIRGFLTNVFANKINSTLPVATPFVNILGSFIIGLIMGMSLNIPWVDSFLVVGILGGLNTFSSLFLVLVMFFYPVKIIYDVLVLY